MLSSNPEDRLKRARVSLEGLSVGDALGDRFFGHADIMTPMIRNRALPNPLWEYTDDTNMALSIYSILRQYGEINQDALARSFAQRYESTRGYGPAMHGLLARIKNGEAWEDVAYSVFAGQGSYGNGGAMRIAPLGAYFADDMEAVIENARLATEVTHAHHEGIVGGIAIAIAAAYACRLRDESKTPSRYELLDMIFAHIPFSEVSTGIRRAHDIAETTKTVDHVVGMIGNGYRITAQDTVPFTLWCVGEQLTHYENAISLTAEGLGDIDTNCAIVGGIVACYTGADSIPAEWIESREMLPEWAFSE
jgi:ADP-ribosylglycohydrolase